MKTALSLATIAGLVSLATSAHADVGAGSEEPVAAVNRLTRFGLKAGVNSSTVSASDAPDSYTLSRRMALNTGVFVVRRLDDRFGLQLEAAISDKGVRLGTSNGRTNVELRYLALPVLARYELAPAARSVRPFVAGGAALGFVLSARIGDEDGSIDVEKETADLEVSGVLAAGMEFPQKLGAVHLEIRYSHGFTNVVSGQFPGDTTTVKNRVASVLIGYVF